MKRLLVFACSFFYFFQVQAEGVNLTNYKSNLCSQVYFACESCSYNLNLIPIKKFSSNSDSLEIEADNSEVINKRQDFKLELGDKIKFYSNSDINKLITNFYEDKTTVILVEASSLRDCNPEISVFYE